LQQRPEAVDQRRHAPWRLRDADQLNLTAVSDRERCPDVEIFADGVRRVLDQMA